MALIAAMIIVASAKSVFEASPLFGMLLFVFVPFTAVVGTFWIKWNSRKEAERRNLELVRQRVETAQHIGALPTGSGQDFEFPVSDVRADKR